MPTAIAFKFLQLVDLRQPSILSYASLHGSRKALIVAGAADLPLGMSICSPIVMLELGMARTPCPALLLFNGRLAEPMN